MTLALVALFLPLFPLSAIQNALLARARPGLVRAAVLLLWPQLGVSLLQILQPEIPQFIVVWALLSAVFYALRLLTVRDLALWASMFASSALALMWGLTPPRADETTLRLFALWFSLPAALLVLLSAALARRFGAAYAGLFTGLAEKQPRLATALIVAMLSAIATAPFPGFFALLELMRGLTHGAALAVLGVWLLWGWAATRLLQGLVAGGDRDVGATDLGRAGLLSYVVTLAAFLALGLLWTGGGL